MKSRWAKASVRRSVLEAPAPGATSSVVRRKTHAADPSPLAIVTAPRASGHAAPVARLHPAAMHPNTATWTKLSPQKSRSEEHTSELQSQSNLVCRLLLEKKN